MHVCMWQYFEYYIMLQLLVRQLTAQVEDLQSTEANIANIREE